MRLVCVLLIFAVFSAAFFSGCGGGSSNDPGIKIVGKANEPYADVRVYPKGHGGEAEYIITSGQAQSDGFFELHVLEEGIYDIDAGYLSLYPGGSTWLHTLLLDVSITSPATDVGTISIPDPVP